MGSPIAATRGHQPQTAWGSLLPTTIIVGTERDGGEDEKSVGGGHCCQVYVRPQTAARMCFYI